MLILGLRTQERIIIWNDEGMKIVITAVSTSPHQTRLAFDAPRAIKIDREKVYIQKKGDML